MQDLQVQEITSKLIFLPGHPPAMLDSDLAEVYGVTTKRLNEAVKRNLDRFPSDFLFQPTLEEIQSHPVLRSQIATSSASAQGRGGRRYRPWLFTREGCNMVATILHTPTAVERFLRERRRWKRAA